MVAVTKQINRDSPLDGNWSRPCSVKFEFQDIDHANKFASVLAELLTKAAQGGDFEIEGMTIGHDVNCKAIVLEAK